jgi:3'(2'), 5'-bisphosphate nucleotidase
MYDNIMKEKELNHLLKKAIKASLEAGNSILDVYNLSDFEVEHKKDSSPLTLADRSAHNKIIEFLEDTNIPILSEEGKDVKFNDRKLWDLFWLVDPLDGTKEFIKRNGEFTVNIALIKKGKPILGVIYVPVKEVLYFGCLNMGSYKLSECKKDAFNIDELFNISESLPLKVWDKKKVCVVGSRSHMSESTLSFVDGLKSQYGDVSMVSRGSSLKLCMVAEGGAQLYPRFAPTMEWDTAAGQAIIENAGGFVLRYPDMSPLSYNKQELTNPWFIVSLNEELIYQKA